MSSARIRHYCLDGLLVPGFPRPLLLVPQPPFLFVLLLYSHGETTRLLNSELSYPRAGVSAATTRNAPPGSPQCLKCTVVLPSCTPTTFLCGQVSCSTEPLGDRGKDLVSGSGRTVPVIQPGGVFILLPYIYRHQQKR